MPREPKEHDAEIEVLAIWLYGAAKEHGKYDAVRWLTREMADAALWMYGLPGSRGFEDSYGVRDLIARFACKLDEMERQHREDNK